MPAIAQALGIQELPGVPLREGIAFALRQKHTLLLLDNFEHLLAAAEQVSGLLLATEVPRFLVTRRAPLRVADEHEYHLSPLQLPPEQPATVADLAGNPAIELFVARAQAMRPNFVLDGGNAATVAAICRRVDGLPLAIELAAARVRVLAPAALLARLGQILPLLSGGRRDAPAPQQTLRGPIGWSYNLLEPAEQRLFRRLAVFSGGCTVESAQAVCDAEGDLGIDTLDGLSSLVENSLVRERQTGEGGPHFGMLDTVREFATEQLNERGECARLQRH